MPKGKGINKIKRRSPNNKIGSTEKNNWGGKEDEEKGV
jgi:hypothetical protein